MTRSSQVFARHAGYTEFTCPECEVTQEAEVYEDPERGTRGFSCSTEGCGFEEHHDINDRGALTVLSTIFWAGFALAMFGATTTLLVPLAVGLMVMFAALTTGGARAANRRRRSS